MKKFLIVSLVLTLLLAGLAATALMNANSLLTALKPDLEKMAGTALRAPVRLGELSVSLIPSTRVTAAEVRVGSMTLRNVTLHARLLPLLGKRLEITQLSLQQPEVILLKGPTGLTVEGVAAPATPVGGGGTSPHSIPAAPAGEQAAGGAPLTLSLDRIEIRDGLVKIREVDRESRISDIFLDAAVRLDGATVAIPSFVLRARPGDAPPLTIEGRDIGIDGAALSGQVTITALKTSANLAISREHTGAGTARVAGTLDLASVRELGDLVPPTLRAMPLTGMVQLRSEGTFGPGDGWRVRGTLEPRDLALAQGAFAMTGGSGRLSFEADPVRQAGAVQELTLSLNGAPMTATLPLLEHTGGKITANGFELRAFGGTLKASASHDLSGQRFSLSPEAANLDLGALLPALRPVAPPPFTGRLESFSATLSGTSSALPTSLTGRGQLAVRDGELKGVNIAGDVLKSVANLPFLTGSLFDSLPEQERAELQRADTKITSLTTNFSLGAGGVTAPNFRLQSSIFSLEADGTIGFDSALNLNATILFSPGFSGLLAGRVREVRAVLDREGRLVIPLRLTGTPERLTVTPNVSRLMQSGAGRIVEEQAGKLLDKALGGKGQSDGLKGILGF